MEVEKAVTKNTKAAKQGKTAHKYFIDFSGPANDGILDAAAFEKFLHDRIKVDGKAGQLGDVVKITREGEGKIWINTKIDFSKRYLKYLTKKHLKKQQLRDWLRVVATSKQGFEIKFFNVSYDQEETEA
ncbi:putative ribosomal protein L22 [Testicularia cyperi]|uniref:Putative ribosomal protein L22 n=1 Tax=Testicularia cyperi TaxID=1882483 RepID=A0A317XIA9_9BASI|nr:putative ribosomal protein L22 [Testicularia cyperi]